MISRLKRLNHVKSVAENNQKISRGLEIIRSQETISLHDPDFIALGLDESQIDKICEMYEKDPQPIRLKESSMILTQDIKYIEFRFYQTLN